jgi:hypothetical protein
MNSSKPRFEVNSESGNHPLHMADDLNVVAIVCESNRALANDWD